MTSHSRFFVSLLLLLWFAKINTTQYKYLRLITSLPRTSYNIDLSVCIASFGKERQEVVYFSRSTRSACLACIPLALSCVCVGMFFNKNRLKTWKKENPGILEHVLSIGVSNSDIKKLFERKFEFFSTIPKNNE